VFKIYQFLEHYLQQYFIVIFEQ